MSTKILISWIVVIILVVGAYTGCGQITQLDDTQNESNTKTVETIKQQESNNDNERISTTTTTKSSGEKVSTTDDVAKDGYTPIKDINNTMKGEYVKVVGYVTKISGGKGHTFFTFKDPNTGAIIKGVLFKQESEADPSRKEYINSSYQNKSIITIEGKVDIYKDELEVIAKKVY